jgi:hypothetical protein
LASRIALIVHERRGEWGRQLRPRVTGLPLVVRETRSAADLKRALQASTVALVVVDLGSSPLDRLADLHLCRDLLADALLLVLDPEAIPGASGLARELGATLVRSGFVSPPDVVRLLERWTALAAHRADAAGWTQREPVSDLLGAP